MAVDVRFLGQACFELKADGATVLTDPFLTGNPLAAASADEVEADEILLTHGHGDHLGDTVDIAKRTGATVLAIMELADEIGGEGVENVVDPNFGGHRPVRLGLGQARAGLAHGGVAERHAAHAGRAADPHRRPPDLPPRRHVPVQRHAADRAARRPGRPRAGADRRPLHDGPLRRRDRRRVHPTRSRSSPATTTRSRRSRADAEAFKSDVQNAGFSEVIVLEPGGTHTVK